MRLLGLITASLIGLTSLTSQAAVRLGSTSFDVIEGAGSVTVTVVLTNQDSATDTVTVNYSTVAGSASPQGSGQGDYDSTAGTLVWNVGDFAAKSFEVVIRNDSIVESNESFFIQLSDPTPGTTALGSPAQAEVTIIDDDAAGAGKFQFGTIDYSVFEGASETAATCPGLVAPNNACLPIRRIGGAAGAVSVEVVRASGGSATPGSDFTDASSSFNWADGDVSTKYFHFRVIDDAIAEPSELIIYRLNNPAGGATIDTEFQTAFVTINDNDASGAGTLRFGLQSYEVFEGVDDSSCPALVAPNNACLPIERVNGSNGRVTVSVQRIGGGTATPGQDFTDSTQLLEWSNGDTAIKYLQFRIIDDSTPESSETIQYQLTNVTGGAVIDPGANSATVIITDTDANAAGVIQFAITDYVVFEGGTESLANCPPLTSPNNACLAVRRIGGNSGSASVEVSRVSGGTATAGTDVVDQAALLTWGNGDSSTRYFQFRVIDDAAVEQDETILYRLFNVTGAELDPARSEVTTTIVDNDAAGPGQIQFALTSYSIVEGTADVSCPSLTAPNNACLAVERLGGTDGAVSVTVARTGGTAVAGSDFAATTQQIAWAAGDSERKYYQFQVIDDASIETDETIVLQLSNPTGGATIAAARGTSTVTIQDNDGSGPGVAQFVQTDVIFFEGSPADTMQCPGITSPNNACLAVRRAGGSSGVVSVDVLRTPGGTAAPTVDFSDSPTVLTWGDGDAATKYFYFEIRNDGAIESSETILYALSTPTGGITIDTVRGEATVTIGDDDVDGPGQIAFNVASSEVFENEGQIGVLVVRTGGTGGSATVNYQTRLIPAADAASFDDFSVARGTLVFQSGDLTPQFINVTINDDAAAENTESFEIALSDATGASLGAQQVHVVRILDNDSGNQGSRMSLSADRYSVSDSGQSVRITVRRGSSNATSSVKLVTEDGSAKAGEDYVAVERDVVFNDGETQRVVDIPVIAGNDPTEPTETFLVTLTEPVGGTLGQPDAAVVTISNSAAGGLADTVSLSTGTLFIDDTSGSAVIQIRRSGAGRGIASVEYATVDGTAVAGADFTATSGTIGWTDGDTGVRTIAIPISGPDVAGEGPETFVFELRSPTNLRLGSPSSATVRISPAAAGATVGFADQGDIVLTPSARSTDVVLTRSGNPAQPLSVRVKSADANATAGVDYVGVDQVVTWAANEGGSKIVPVRALYLPETRNELEFDLNLTVESGVVSISQSRATVRILPEAVSTVRFGNLTHRVMDGDGRATIIIERSNPSSPASVRVTTVDGSARGGEDYVAYDEIIGWDRGDSAPKLVTIQLIQSPDPVPTRSFSVSLTPNEGSGLTAVDSNAAFATVDMKSTAAEISQGIGGCSVGRSDNVTLPAMLLAAFAWLAIRRRTIRVEQ